MHVVVFLEQKNGLKVFFKEDPPKGYYLARGGGCAWIFYSMKKSFTTTYYYLSHSPLGCISQIISKILQIKCCV